MQAQASFTACFVVCPPAAVAGKPVHVTPLGTVGVMRMSPPLGWLVVTVQVSAAVLVASEQMAVLAGGVTVMVGAVHCKKVEGEQGQQGASCQQEAQRQWPAQQRACMDPTQSSGCTGACACMSRHRGPERAHRAVHADFVVAASAGRGGGAGPHPAQVRLEGAVGRRQGGGRAEGGLGDPADPA